MHSFQLIAVDPPWEYGDKLRNTKTLRGAQDVYSARLTYRDLVALPVSAIADERALLLVWCTSSHLQQALSLIPAWGFRYTQAIVWGKVQKGNPAKPRIGMGRLFRQSAEFGLIGVRGGAHGALALRNKSSLFLGTQLPHSTKPETVQDDLEQMFPTFTRRLELFARRKRKGWVCLGNEIDGRDIRESIAGLVPESEAAE